MSIIKDVKAREILDSRGNPTIEVDIICEDGSFGRSSVPSGASTGINEALELRDNDHRYMGKGVLKAVNNVNNVIKPRLIGMNVTNQRDIDTLLITIDGTENKSNLGANSMIGVSLSCLKAAADYMKLPLYKYVGNNESLPSPMMNILNGGAHADNNLDFQEFMIVPEGDSFKEKLRKGTEVFHTLKKVLKNKGLNTSVGDEGGFAPSLKSNTEAFDLIMEAIRQTGFIPGRDISIALDIAASQFYKDGKYKLIGENKTFDSTGMISFYEELISKYPIISIEDGLEETDFEGFKLMTERVGNKVQLVGDDLFVTNAKLLQQGIDNNACNAILLKANQIGTVSEMLDTIKLAKKNNYKTVISHRSGETEDTFIADLAVGLGLGQIKTGSLSRTDRTCKYNQLLRIEEELSNDNK